MSYSLFWDRKAARLSSSGVIEAVTRKSYGIPMRRAVVKVEHAYGYWKLRVRGLIKGDF